MTDAQSNKLDMFHLVNDFYLQNQVVLDAVLARATAFTALSDNIKAINLEAGLQSTNTTGVAKDKSELRNTLDNTTLSILQSAKAWALATDNNTLAAEFDYSLTDLQRIKDDTMQGFCDYRITLINDNLASLADYGIDAASVTAWENALDAYVALLSGPREAVNARHLHTQNLKALFSSTSELFSEQLDPLMVIFKTTDPALYSAYKQARIIINRGGKPSDSNTQPKAGKLFGTVTNAMDGVGISGANIFYSPSESPITTAVDGTYEKEALPTGETPIHVEATGFESFDTTITLEENADFELSVQLNPTPPIP